MNFIDAFERQANMTESEKGGVVFKSISNPLLDLYSHIGGMRNRNEDDIVSQWLEARIFDKELTDNLILYTRDFRNTGIGERKIGRILLKELATIDPHKIERNFQTIVDVGRWDDLFVFVGTPVEKEMWNFIEKQLLSDVEGMKNKAPISLLGKWLPSINTSSKKTRALARRACVQLNLTERAYRKTLSALRKYIGVVETLMSVGKWNEINFEAVPSIAMSRYINTYNKHCQERFAEYKAALVKGEAKVNAGALTPADICKKFITNGGYKAWTDCYWYGGKPKEIKGVLDGVDMAQWSALPNYVEGNQDVIVLSDLSGSMMTPSYEPISTSVGLAVYFAQRNKGAYKNLFMIFASEPAFIKIEDNWDIEKCFSYVLGQQISYSTNMDRAFKAIYEMALKTHETPKAICVISDGEMDRWVQDKASDSIVSKWNNGLIEAGLNPIKVISWNVANRHDTNIAPASDYVSYCSGFSAGSFAHFSSLINKTAEEAMVEILSKPQFQWK
jgi:hypothetical protein